MYETIDIPEGEKCEKCKKEIKGLGLSEKYYDQEEGLQYEHYFCPKCGHAILFSAIEKLKDEMRKLLKRNVSLPIDEWGSYVAYKALGDDIQITAKRLIGRELTDDELYSACKGIAWGLGTGYDIVLKSAVEGAVGN